MAADGEKLSMQNGAEALSVTDPLKTLNAAAKVLNLSVWQGCVADALLSCTAEWLKR
jgi:glutamyl-Q tRNA(Asp) synthetase